MEVLGLEPSTSCMLSACSTTELPLSHPEAVDLQGRRGGAWLWLVTPLAWCGRTCGSALRLACRGPRCRQASSFFLGARREKMSSTAWPRGWQNQCPLPQVWWVHSPCCLIGGGEDPWCLSSVGGLWMAEWLFLMRLWFELENFCSRWFLKPSKQTKSKVFSSATFLLVLWNNLFRKFYFYFSSFGFVSRLPLSP